MRVSSNELKYYRVETVSGVVLGRVHSVVLDTDGQMVTHYDVRRLLFAGARYLISRDQIVRFEQGRMVVDDNVKPVAEPVRAPRAAIKPEPVAMRSSGEGR